MNTISVKECVGFGWRTFKSRPWFFIGVTFVLMFVSGIGEMISGILGPSSASDIVTIIFLGFNLLLTLGATSIYLVAHDSISVPSLKDLWHPNSFLKYVGTTFLIFIIVIVGLILLIVPGIIAAIAFSFAPYLVIEKGLGPIEAMKESMRITKGNRVKLFLLIIASGLLSILGLILVGVGLLVTTPIVMLAMVHAYRTLSANAAPEAHEEAPPETVLA